MLGGLRDGDVLLFVCSFVCLSPVKSFATWQHVAVSGGLSNPLRYTCSILLWIVVQLVVGLVVYFWVSNLVTSPFLKDKN